MGRQPEPLIVSKARTALALVAAPLLTPLVFNLHVRLEGVFAGRPMPSIRDAASGLVFCCMFVLPFAYAAELALGVPVWVMFRRYRIHSVSAFALGGTAIGWAVALVVNASTDWFTAGGDLDCILAASGSAVAFRAIAGSGLAAPGRAGRMAV